MFWLLIPIIIWITALIVLGFPKMIEKKLQRVKGNLKAEAEAAVQSNPDESIYKGIEKGILEAASMQNLCFISSIIGLLLMALGTVALCAVLLL
jgi:hypothetical protein